jgi:hypothetical protein
MSDTVNGKVVAVEMGIQVPYAPPKQGSYLGARLTFDAFNKINTKTFTERTLEFNPQIREALEGLNPGDSFVMHQEKNGKYQNVTSIEKTTGTATSAPVRKVAMGVTVARDNRQESIVFQSSLKVATEIVALKLNVDEVVAMAKKLAILALNPDLSPTDAKEEDDEDVF